MNPFFEVSWVVFWLVLGYLLGRIDGHRIDQEGSFSYKVGQPKLKERQDAARPDDHK